MELKFKLMPTSFKFLKGQVCIINKEQQVLSRVTWVRTAQLVPPLVVEKRLLWCILSRSKPYHMFFVQMTALFERLKQSVLLRTTTTKTLDGGNCLF